MLVHYRAKAHPISMLQIFFPSDNNNKGITCYIKKNKTTLAAACENPLIRYNKQPSAAEWPGCVHIIHKLCMQSAEEGLTCGVMRKGASPPPHLPRPVNPPPTPPGEKGLIGVGISSHICQIFKAVTHWKQRVNVSKGGGGGEGERVGGEIDEVAGRGKRRRRRKISRDNERKRGELLV